MNITVSIEFDNREGQENVLAAVRGTCAGAMRMVFGDIAHVRSTVEEAERRAPTPKELRVTAVGLDHGRTVLWAYGADMEQFSLPTNHVTFAKLAQYGLRIRNEA